VSATAERGRLIEGHVRRYRIAGAAERLVAALEEQEAAGRAWATPERVTLTPDVTQDEIEACGQRQRDADAAVRKAQDELRKAVRS
jgi:hypothetical protein